ncbi:MAG: 50S ribosomal protein L3 N(5)-glutamine methyltransferase [Gammaproteobacteria bacterium]|nr:50S ribosomal protein L3 N(5)-glutamine methyltransferase [Gammaproteobacteria bacterium]
MAKLSVDSVSETKTLNDWVQTVAAEMVAAQLYFGHGTDNAVDEAFWLVLHALQRSPQESVEDLHEALSAAQGAAIQALLQQRISTRKPLAYLTGTAWFCGLPFQVDERVLVPRSPLAELIMVGFEPWLLDVPSRILDLCTGSACIAIACAYAFPEAFVDATDIDAGALSVAQANVQMHDLHDRLRLYQADVFTGLPPQRYDLIVSNPPYVDEDDFAQMPTEYHQEPVLGLIAGADGLLIARQILQQASDFLTPEGWLVMEVGNSMEALIRAYPDVPFIWPEFAEGGHGVLMISAADLMTFFESSYS